MCLDVEGARCKQTLKMAAPIDLGDVRCYKLFTPLDEGYEVHDCYFSVMFVLIFFHLEAG